jgi:hypothetical protein
MRPIIETYPLTVISESAPPQFDSPFATNIHNFVQELEDTFHGIRKPDDLAKLLIDRIVHTYLKVIFDAYHIDYPEVSFTINEGRRAMSFSLDFGDKRQEVSFKLQKHEPVLYTILTHNNYGDSDLCVCQTIPGITHEHGD